MLASPSSDMNREVVVVVVGIIERRHCVGWAEKASAVDRKATRRCTIERIDREYMVAMAIGIEWVCLCANKCLLDSSDCD